MEGGWGMFYHSLYCEFDDGEAGGGGKPGEGCEAGEGCEPGAAAEMRSDEEACCRGDGGGGLTGLTGLGGCTMMKTKWLWGERQCRCYHDGRGDGRPGDDAHPRHQLHLEGLHSEPEGDRDSVTCYEDALLQTAVDVATNHTESNSKKFNNDV